MEKKTTEVIVNDIRYDLKSQSMTITQLPCSNKRDAIKVFNKLKKNIPKHYRAALVKYESSTGEFLGDTFHDLHYYLVVSRYDFRYFNYIKGYTAY